MSGLIYYFIASGERLYISATICQTPMQDQILLFIRVTQTFSYLPYSVLLFYFSLSISFSPLSYLLALTLFNPHLPFFFFFFIFCSVDEVYPSRLTVRFSYLDRLVSLFRVISSTISFYSTRCMFKAIIIYTEKIPFCLMLDISFFSIICTINYI